MFKDDKLVSPDGRKVRRSKVLDKLARTLADEEAKTAAGTDGSMDAHGQRAFAAGIDLDKIEIDVRTDIECVAVSDDDDGDDDGDDGEEGALSRKRGDGDICVPQTLSTRTSMTFASCSSQTQRQPQ